jgi:hypothetical protein
VNYEIVEIEQFSGCEAKVYSIIPEGDEITLYDRFIEGHKNQYKGELKQINNRLKQMKIILNRKEIMNLSENMEATFMHFTMKKTVI